MPDGKRFFVAIFLASCQSKILAKFYNIPIAPVCVKLIFLDCVKEISDESKPSPFARFHAQLFA